MLIAAVLGALLTATPAAAASQAERRGLWIGTMQVCGGGVERADIVPDETLGYAIVLTFTAAFRERLGAETARRVGRHIPIRLDGRLILDPIVNEPITGGQVQLLGASRDDAETLRRAASRPC